jgi:hypothetical protein
MGNVKPILAGFIMSGRHLASYPSLLPDSQVSSLTVLLTHGRFFSCKPHAAYRTTPFLHTEPESGPEGSE